jgi:hypothetical protein
MRDPVVGGTGDRILIFIADNGAHASNVVIGYGVEVHHRGTGLRDHAEKEPRPSPPHACLDVVNALIEEDRAIY